MSDDLHDFPEMTEEYLHILFQLFTQASYLAEIMDRNDNIGLQYAKTAGNILKISKLCFYLSMERHIVVLLNIILSKME